MNIRPFALPTFLLLSIIACNGGKGDSQPPGGTDGTDGTDGTGTEEGWCAVQSLFNNECTSCHSAAGHQGDLDLETDPYAALVGVPSAAYGDQTLVVPGDSATSFLYIKMMAQQTASEGGDMPPAGILGATFTDLVKVWIDGGATAECTGPIDTGSTGYHPAGFSDPTVHGIEAKFQEQVCTSCHGADLTGDGDAPSCDTCHTGGDTWRTSCTFCHGGDEDSSGAPPEDIDDSSTSISFPEHGAHVQETIHTAWGCEQCHQTPTDIFTAGHLFTGDSSPGNAELVFTAGHSSVGSFSSGSCSNLYCHGNGQSGSTGSATTGSSTTCHSCHGDASSSTGSLSGDHDDHLDEGLSCDDCHGDAASNTSIDVPAEHVDGNINVDLPSTITFTDNHCTGSCHGENHHNENW